MLTSINGQLCILHGLLWTNPAGTSARKCSCSHSLTHLTWSWSTSSALSPLDGYIPLRCIFSSVYVKRDDVRITGRHGECGTTLLWRLGPGRPLVRRGPSGEESERRGKWCQRGTHVAIHWAPTPPPAVQWSCDRTALGSWKVQNQPGRRQLGSRGEKLRGSYKWESGRSRRACRLQ